MIKCIIFDFDETLVDTSMLKGYRDKGEWSQCNKKASETSLYPGVKKVLDDLGEKGIAVAIASNSPKGTIKTILREHKVKFHDDDIVAYHDVQKHKPDSECLDRITTKNNLHKNEVIYVGNDTIDYNTAKNAGVGFLGVEWGEFNDLPNVEVTNYYNLLDQALEKPFLDTILRTRPSDSSLILKERNISYLGYYIAHSSKYLFTAAKRKILDFKDNNTEAENQWLSLVKANCGELNQADIIVRALGHNEKRAGDNRIDPICEEVARQLGARYVPTILEKKKTKKSTALNKQDRKSEIKGKYKVNEKQIDELDNVEVKRILIVDDIYTTGATTNEITRVLRNRFDSVEIDIFVLLRTASEETVDKETQNTELLKQLAEASESRLSEENTRRRRAPVRRYTANYVNTNSNFVILNLYDNSIYSIEKNIKKAAPISILKNILQRGRPTLPSVYLKQNIPKFNIKNAYGQSVALYDSTDLKWLRIFKDSEYKSQARKFLEIIVSKYFDEYAYVRNLIIPEIKITDITLAYDENLHNQRVDFFLPQAYLVIEIDGEHHSTQREADDYRDFHLKKSGIRVFRIRAKDIDVESDKLHQQIEEIKLHIAEHENAQSEYKLKHPEYISLSDYKKAYFQKTSNDNFLYISTAVARFQILLLELIENNILKLEESWDVAVRCRDVSGFTEYAVNDLKQWLFHIYQLLGIEIQFSKILTTEIKSDREFSQSQAPVKVDFSLFQRYTDQFQDDRVVYVRTHYLDYIKTYDVTNVYDLRACEYENYDYFHLSTIKRINYHFDDADISRYEKSLLFFLKNIFLPDIENVEFREGQLNIILNALSGNDTIGLLPTGSGKSVCYQLAAILQPAISFVVCPIKSLMYDQKIDLDAVKFDRTNYITSDQSAEEKSKVQKEFSTGKYQFIFVSPERFQTKTFRQSFSILNQERSFAYAVIDEVHCLSEWGHDFRTSYLNLSNAINTLASDTRYIGLTATASVNVLKDIQMEFKIHDFDIMTPSNYTREELEFHVVDDEGDKYKSLKETLYNLNTDYSFINEEVDKCGLVFTPTVNGKSGCYILSNKLSEDLGINVEFYSGGKPKEYSGKVSFEDYKKYVQEGFKQNSFPLLIATKAFGMGVNKGNIFFTIHYGIPGSMEALYQEAGRAGRDKKLFIENKAKCITLLRNEGNSSQKLWDPDVDIEGLEKEVKTLDKYGDLYTNFFLFINGINTINDDFTLMKGIYTTYYDDQNLTQLVSARSIGGNKSDTEKAIYKLSCIGIVRDWIVENFIEGVFEVYFNKHDDKSVKNALEKNIMKYEPGFRFESFSQTSSRKIAYVINKYESIDLYFLILLIWSYEHFAYNRRQSLKNVYENCQRYCKGDVNSDEFKATLENYFKFDSATNSIQEMADNPEDYNRWFSILFKNMDTDEHEIHDKSTLLKIKGQLSRFLESYADNTALNILSGFVRLLLDDFNDSDGEKRLQLGIENILSYDEPDKSAALLRLYEFIDDLDVSFQKAFHNTFFNSCNDMRVLINYYERDNNQDVYNLILIKYNQKLHQINTGLREMKW